MISKQFAKILSLGIAFATLLASCRTLDESASARMAAANIKRSDGTRAGSASVYRNGDEITLSVALWGFDPGALELRLEEAGACQESVPSSRSHANGPLTIGQNGSGFLDVIPELPPVPIGSMRSGTASAAFSAVADVVLSRLFGPQTTAIMVYDQARDRPDHKSLPAACGIFEQG